jgi:hypothetical protein
LTSISPNAPVDDVIRLNRRDVEQFKKKHAAFVQAHREMVAVYNEMMGRALIER